MLGLQVSNNVFNAIEECPDFIFPCIREIIFILYTLPVSVATAERSFSTLRTYHFHFSVIKLTLKY
jgi:hypothetical protein